MLSNQCKNSNKIPALPKKYSYKNGNISPPVPIKQVKGAKSYALLCCDAEVPPGIVPNNIWYHWLVQYIPPQYEELHENASADDKKIIQGYNTWGNIGYGGPSPPPGQTHKYLFNVYALSASFEGNSPDQPEAFIKMLKRRKGLLLDHKVYCATFSNPAK